ncbi:hypothetical protein EDC01DRAFT_640673 [Geopyxis carbonaria]|nr:hypothetical protein EDC01DRAFT_640673 [Geopyxis carbonaria]
MSGLFDLSSQTALVTGGTRGIGRTMALALARAGADIVLVQRDTSNTATQSEITALGRKCSIHVADLSSPSEVAAIFPAVTATTKITILLNCAGIQRRHPAHQFPDSDWNEVLQTNLSTVFALCRAAGAYWIAADMPGRIVNVASLLSFQGGFTVPAYSAAKAGVVGITKALSNEWAGKSIGVNAIAPGYIATDMNEALINDETRAKQIMDRIPAGRWGRPEDFEGVVVFLASARASGYVSGETVVVDGGWMGR